MTRLEDITRGSQLAGILPNSLVTVVEGLARAGIVQSGSGKVKLKSREQMDPDWDPMSDTRLTVWEVTQHLIRALDKQGERAAAAILKKVGGDYGETARDLAYRLYTTCERKGWAQEALA